MEIGTIRREYTKLKESIYEPRKFKSASHFELSVHYEMNKLHKEEFSYLNEEGKKKYMGFRKGCANGTSGIPGKNDEHLSTFKYDPSRIFDNREEWIYVAEKIEEKNREINIFGKGFLHVDNSIPDYRKEFVEKHGADGESDVSDSLSAFRGL